MTALLWLRRDLRLHDHPALQAALETGEDFVPVFCLDPRLLHGRHASGPRTQFLLESLTDLDESLRICGSRLLVRQGPPVKVVPELVRELEASHLFWTSDVSPFATQRDDAVRRALHNQGVEVHEAPGLFVLDDPAAPRTTGGKPYRVFTPFHRSWLTQDRREVLPPPRSLPSLPAEVRPVRRPTLGELGLQETVESPLPGGEQAGRQRMHQFVAEGLSGYARGSEDLAAEGTSRLSAYLHFGCVSPRELEALLPDVSSAEEFRRQLCWRDFYAHVLANFPDNAQQEFQERYRGSIRWSTGERQFQAWCEGRTGYPLVDAAMRQLRREGWMPNRARLVVGSFLTKDLGIDWRRGERWFMRLLIDGDEANNNGNWQWIASVGVDPQPPFRRMYNPARQQVRFDPTGAYVRRHLPELRDVPDEYLAEPWKMPEEVQQAAGCIIGIDYPEPIVEHAAARRAALARYAETPRV